LVCLATIENEQGNPAEARRLLQQSLGIAEQLGDLSGQSACAHLLAIVESNQGNHAEARRLLHRSLSIAERLGNLGARATSLHHLAMIEDAQCNPTEARRLWEQSITLSRQIGNLEAQATTLMMLAQLEFKGGKLETALGMARESVRLLDGIGNAKVTMAREVLAILEDSRAGRSSEVYAEAMAKGQAGDKAGALGLFEESLVASRKEGAAHGVAANLCMIGQTLMILGRADEARDRLREGLEVAHEVGDKELLKTMQQYAAMAAAKFESATAAGTTKRDENVSEQ
jgi:tetratricopeptide (TPR) repeat protein